MTDSLRLASGRFARGYSCSQSVFSAFAERIGLTTDMALKLAGPFGGGIARQGETCGALSGALMVLGLQYANTRPEGKEEIYRIAREFIEQFRQRQGATLCRELVGFDISTPEGLAAAREDGAFGRICPHIVEQTAQALEKYLDEHQASEGAAA